MERIRILVISFASFFVAVVLTWALPGFPAFSFAATLVSFIYANLHDEERSLVFGFITGLFLDFLTQELPGINALALALTSVTTSRLRKLFSYESPVWFFMSGTLNFIVRSLFVLIAHAVIDGTLLVTTDLRAYVSAALWTGIIGTFYFMALKKA